MQGQKEEKKIELRASYEMAITYLSSEHRSDSNYKLYFQLVATCLLFNINCAHDLFKCNKSKIIINKQISLLIHYFSSHFLP